MTFARLLPILALAALSFAAPAVAGSHRGAPPVSRPGLPLDPELLPPNSGPGDCVVRRVTGPGGAYRWDRVECDSDRGRSNHEQWGYGRNRLEVETRDGRPSLLGGYDGDRYGHGDRYVDHRRGEALYDRRVDEYELERSRGYDSGYVGGGYVRNGYVQGGYAQDGYGYGYAYGDGYAQGGRREDRYGPSPGVDYGYYGAAGRDEAGYLVWPGKLP
jgi:hypothetical protein